MLAVEAILDLLVQQAHRQAHRALLDTPEAKANVDTLEAWAQLDTAEAVVILAVWDILDQPVI
jgi:hypothetical protein